MQILTPVLLPPALYFLALAAVLVASYYDIRWRRIPNWLVLSLLLAGFLGSWTLGGVNLLQSSVLGFGLALLLYFPLYVLRGMGAGDVKLMAALGATFGYRNWLILALIAALFSAAAGLTLAASKGRFRSTLINVGFIVKELISFRLPHVGRKEIDIHHSSAIRLPHGVSIAVGTVTLVALTVLDGRL